MRVWMPGWRDRRRDSRHGVSAPRTRLYSCWLIERSVNLNFPPTGYISHKVVCLATCIKKSLEFASPPPEMSLPLFSGGGLEARVLWRCGGDRLSWVWGVEVKGLFLVMRLPSVRPGGVKAQTLSLPANSAM